MTVSTVGERPGTVYRIVGTSRRLGRRIADQALVRVVARRLLLMVPLLFVVTALTFVLTSLTPGDAARAILGREAPREAYVELRHQLGLDLPIYEQYWNWVSRASTGDLGASLYSGQSVTQAINERLPVTLSLIAGALLFTVIVGLGLGMVSALRGGVLGRVLDAFALVAFAVPAFWAGAILISVFAVKLGWLPPTDYVPLTEGPGSWARSLVLPVTALALGGIAAVAKQTREAMLDVLGSEYIRMARANGIRSRSIVMRHALKNAAIRVVTILGVQAVGLLGGAVIVEFVFGLPGLGSLLVTATVQHNLPVIQGIVVYFTVIVVVINLVVDVSYAWLNPKVRVS